MNGHNTIVKIHHHFGDAHFIPKMNFDPVLCQKQFAYFFHWLKLTA